MPRADERLKYLLTEAGPLAAFMLCGVLFWVLGRPTRTSDAAREQQRAF